MRNLSLAVLSLALITATGVAEARWLSVDPVKANPSNGQNNNRYYYANNNPYKFVDPDGRVVVYANDAAKRLADETRGNSKVADRLLTKLENSKNTWNLDFKSLRANSKPASESNTTYADQSKIHPLADGSANAGSGGTIIVNRNRETVAVQIPGRDKPTPTVIKPAEVLVHEMGHAVEADAGLLPQSRNDRELNGNARREEDAYRSEKGLPGYRTGVENP